MSRLIDLNADIGELPGETGRTLDASILEAVTSCNIACGGHAGDSDSMRETLRLAKLNGVNAGAHPSYPDREGFGRREIDISLDALRSSLLDQVRQLQAVAKEQQVELSHLKPHGALYNAAAQSEELAELVVSVTRECGIARIVGLPESHVQTAAEAAGLMFWGEGFADRSYEADGSLTPRSEDGAVLETEVDQMKQALALAKGLVTTRNGEVMAVNARTICVHGDTRGAQKATRAIREALSTAGFELG